MENITAYHFYMLNMFYVLYFNFIFICNFKFVSIGNFREKFQPSISGWMSHVSQNVPGIHITLLIITSMYFR